MRGRPALIILKGQRFNNLRVIKETDPVIKPNGRKTRYFLFKCDCGNRKVIRLSDVTGNNTVSCGCYAAESVRIRQTKHGFSAGSVEEKKLYYVWRNMHKRCYDENNSNYKNYHGRNITVAKIWHGEKGLIKFVAWALNNGYKIGLQLDRRNNDESYTPTNCRFVTGKRNARNTHKTIMILHPLNKKVISLIDYYEQKPRKVSYDRFRAKFHAGKYPHLKIA